MWVSFFFFKQKTAYEVRISDWSSDVCSSDLQGLFAIVRDEGQDFAEFGEALQRVAGGHDLVLLLGGDDRRRLQQAALGQPLHLLIVRERLPDRQRARGPQRQRREEDQPGAARIHPGHLARMPLTYEQQGRD